MLFATPTGTSIHSFQFRLKYPKIKSNEPSAFCSQPSYTGEMFKPVVGCCASGLALAAARVTKTRTTIALGREIDGLTAASPRLPGQATWAWRESSSMRTWGNRGWPDLQPG